MSDAPDEPGGRRIPYFATCAAGTELALKQELRELGMHRVRADRGGVRFEGSSRDALRACLGSRIAVRILQPVARIAAPDGDALYEGVRAIEWERWITPRHTLAVSAVSRQSALRHTGFVAQRTKDGVVDRVREREGSRPSVDRRDPDVAIFVHLVRDVASVLLDVSGGSLHRRGWRTAVGPAPLKETLAAAVLRLAGWDRARPLVDPACGSGTIPIEADLWARDVAPGLGRSRFGLERWASHDEQARRAFAELRDMARRAARNQGPFVLGTDVDARAIEVARANARRAASHARLRRAPLRDLAPPRGALVLANVPYGRRLHEGDVWRDLEQALPRLVGCRLGLLFERPPPRGLLPHPVATHGLWNGKLPCRLAVWELG